MKETPWSDYFDSLTDRQLAELPRDSTVELYNNVMREEDEELAELEAQYGLPRGFWTPAQDIQYINESQDFLYNRRLAIEAHEIDLREQGLLVEDDSITDEEEAEMAALQAEMDDLMEKERQLEERLAGQEEDDLLAS